LEVLFLNAGKEIDMNLKKYFFSACLAILVAFTAKKFLVFSGEFVNASATLSNARLSFKGALEGAQTVGSSLVTIDTTNYPSTSVLQLQSGDTVLINANEYEVATTIDDINDDNFNMTSALISGDELDDTDVYATQSSSLTVRLTTISALNSGSFRILVPAAADNGTDNDGYPDEGGFDFGNADGVEASITCPTGPGTYGTFTDSSTPAETSTVVIDTVPYHVFECAYSGVGGTGTVFDGTANDAFVINDLINPAPKVVGSAHVLGQADTYAVIIQHLDSSDTVIDQTVTKVGVVDAVRVSATIAPQLTFTVAGIAASTTVCDVATDVTTTALTVPFGELTIASFKNAAQRLTVTTNAVGGYVVTAIENDQLGRGGNTCTGDGSASPTCIVDVSAAGASHTTSADWTDASTEPGFGYSLDQVTAGLTPAFLYDDGGSTFFARQFADMEDGEPVQTIFSRDTVAASDVVDVCYQITPDATNVAGNYENYLVYTASATF
jgi:hypothetical protein